MGSPCSGTVWLEGSLAALGVTFHLRLSALGSSWGLHLLLKRSEGVKASLGRTEAGLCVLPLQPVERLGLGAGAEGPTWRP